MKQTTDINVCFKSFILEFYNICLKIELIVRYLNPKKHLDSPLRERQPLWLEQLRL